MGIFSWLFSKNTENDSRIRKWIVQEMEKVDNTNPDVYALFLGLIHAAVQCGKHSAEEQDEQQEQVARQYLGDATIFEIACYTYYRLEDWIAKNQPELVSEIAIPISNWIVERFSVTFYVEEQQINQLFEERLERYKTMTACGNGLGESQLELEQRILMTKGDKFNKTYLPPSASSITPDSQHIRVWVAKYEEFYIPVVITAIQDYCKKATQNKLKQNQPAQNQEQKDFLYGMALVSQQDWVRACKAFTKVLSANPEHYDALVQRGLLYITLYQPADALHDFTTAIKVKPSQSAAYLHRGKCYHRNLRLRDESLADYSVAIDLAPGTAAGYFGRGELYDEIALDEEKQALENNDHTIDDKISEAFLAAIQDYTQVIAIEPDHDSAYTNRGLAYARKARVTKNAEFIEKAIADFERAMSLNWENGYLYKQQDEMKELLEQISQSGGQAEVEISKP